MKHSSQKSEMVDAEAQQDKMTKYRNENHIERVKTDSSLTNQRPESEYRKIPYTSYTSSYTKFRENRARMSRSKGMKA